MTQAFNLSQFANKVNSTGQADLTTAVTGTLPIANGGTGQTGTPANGEVLIGNGTGFTKSTITAGTNISVTNTAGGITIANTASGGLGGMQVFTANGTFTIPSGVTNVKVTIVGGGGGGASGSSAGGGGGAGGGACIKFLTGLTSGNTLSVTVGSAGSGGSSGYYNSGGTGGTSSVASGTQTITTLSATGGAGGKFYYASNTSPYGAGSQGGIGSNGNMNIRGGGGSPAPTLYGGNYVQIGGFGGGSILGGQGYMNSTTATPANGASGSAYGGGGTGGYSDGCTLYSGGAGATGIVIFEW